MNTLAHLLAEGFSTCFKHQISARLPRFAAELGPSYQCCIVRATQLPEPCREFKAGIFEVCPLAAARSVRSLVTRPDRDRGPGVGKQAERDAGTRDAGTRDDGDLT